MCFPEQCRRCNFFNISLLDGFCYVDPNNPIPLSETSELPDGFMVKKKDKILCKNADYQLEFDFIRKIKNGNK
jgi:hypothetical protein